MARSATCGTISIVLRHRFPWERVVLLALVLAASLAILTIWGTESLEKALTLTGVGLTTCLVWVVKGVRDWRLGVADVDSSRLSFAAEQLGRAVHRMWQGEAANRGLTSPLTIAVDLAVANPNITAHAAQWLAERKAESPGDFGGDGSLTQLGTATQMAAIYSRIRTGKMVIIGEPGGGKTAAAILLMLEIYKTRAPDSRVPVFFQLATWRVDKVPLNDWMIEQLVASYGAPPKLARPLVQEDRILPLFDGLDEVSGAGRRAAITALRGLADTPFILTCRASEYIAIASDAVLEAAGVVEVTPVSITTAINYLSSSGSADSSRWDSVIAALRVPGVSPCKAALSNPLMLSLARTVFRSASSQPSEMTTWRTFEEFEDRLLDGLIPAVYSRSVDDISADDALRLLRFLSDHLSVIGPGLIAWWKLSRCIPAWRLRGAAGALCGLGGALYVAVTLGLYLLSGNSLDSGPLPVAATVYPIVASCIIAGVFANPRGRDPLFWTRPALREILRSTLKGFLLLLCFAVPYVSLSLAIPVTATDDALTPAANVGNVGIIAFDILDPVLSWGIFFVAPFLLVRAVMDSFTSTQVPDIDPVSGFRRDLRSGLLAAMFGLIALCILMIVYSITYSLTTRSALPGLVDSMPVIALIAGMFFPWFICRYSSMLPYGVAVLILRRRGTLNARPLKFLEDAYRRGILRKSGMTYEFRHARLAGRLRSTRANSGRRTVTK